MDRAGCAALGRALSRDTAVTYLVPHSTGIEDVGLNKRRRQVAADALVAYSRKGAFDDEEEPVRPEALIS
jgi:hypothetical protein